ncbi:hypothetical protein CBER1_08479 [Cercospora berteroae]|uniref:Uncharacterized protein n=1 Tax=Cercospora berteroae TaxID=357750 RepID=A0A2S6BVV4_9PEZI|nr:hypothetical protein CBER1_08479 [Cercospora berteroae]
MSTSHNVRRKPIGSPSIEEPASTEAQLSLLPHHDSEDAFRKERSLVSGETKVSSAPKANDCYRQSSQSLRKRRRFWQPISTWWQEALAIVWLLGSLVASFATLYPYQGKPIPEWRYSITIGALLSLYSVILRLAATFLLSQGIAQLKWQWFNNGPKPLHDMVLHDNASRGPMGAFGLLYRLALPVTWQWLGCVLAVVALLVGPFTQQILQYETCAVLDPVAAALVTRTSAFMGKTKANTIGIDTDGYLSFQEQASFMAGLYSPGTVVSSCSSGNCTFAPYTTMGYVFDVVGNVTTTSLVLEFDDDVSRSRSKTTLEANYTSWDLVTGGSTIDQCVATGAMSGGSYTLLIPLAERPRDLNTGSAPAECTYATNAKSWRCQGYGAASCSITPCLRTYNSTITNGVLHEQLIGLETEILKATPGIWHGSADAFERYTWLDSYTAVQAALSLSCVNEDDRAMLRNRGYDLSTEDTWLPYNLTDKATFWEYVREPNSDSPNIALMERGFIDRGCLYVFPYDFTPYLRKFLGELHSGELIGSGSFLATKAMAGMNGSQILQSVWNYGYFSLERTASLFDNMTLSLSKYLRTNPGTPSRATHVREDWSDDSSITEHDDDYIDVTTFYLPAIGQAWTTKTCARIRWPWLILPAIVTIFTLVFYVGVLISALALPEDVRTWKTSPLPFMFYGPGGTDEFRQQEWFKATSQHVDDMDAAARKIHLKLDRDETGLAFFRKRGAVIDAERSSLTSGSDAVL